jgi:glycogen operon protein
MAAGRIGAAPPGATVLPNGVNFSVFSKDASRIDLLLFDRAGDARPARIIPIDPATNRQYHSWHVFVPGVQSGQLYGYSASGPFDPASGRRFDHERALANNITNLILDPIWQPFCEKHGIDPLDVIEQEPDAGLGNGGTHWT